MASVFKKDKALKEWTLKSIYRIIILFCHLFPIKKNKIFLFSYYGSQYSCNPKYITEYILRNYPKGHFDLVWAFNDPKSKCMPGVRKVKTMSLLYFYEMCTSKVIITNFRTTGLFIKRKEQYYIQTWHSSLRLKAIEKDTQETLPESYVEMAKIDSSKCDLLLSGCEFSTQIFKSAFWYEGEIFKCGTPRNDILFSNPKGCKRTAAKKLGFSNETKVVLYAPTFRNGNNVDVYDIDYQSVLESLRRALCGEWIFLVRLHPHLLSKSGTLLNEENVIDVTAYDDIQELLCLADILITDYSSLMFDFAITGRPCFLYLPDLDHYTVNDRHLYFDIEELPFIRCKKNEELIEQIINFNEEIYAQELNAFLTHIGSYENGGASRQLVELINQICLGEARGGIYETT